MMIILLQLLFSTAKTIIRCNKDFSEKKFSGTVCVPEALQNIYFGRSYSTLIGIFKKEERERKRISSLYRGRYSFPNRMFIFLLVRKRFTF